jgi:hypothetical protein
MTAVRNFGSYSPGVEASQSGDDEAEDSAVFDYGSVVLIAA